MKTRKDKREVRVGDHRRTHLGDTLESLSEDVRQNLEILKDLSIALERESSRLDEIQSNSKVPIEEVCVTYALLTALRDKSARLSKDVAKVAGIFCEVLRRSESRHRCKVG